MNNSSEKIEHREHHLHIEENMFSIILVPAANHCVLSFLRKKWLVCRRRREDNDDDGGGIRSVKARLKLLVKPFFCTTGTSGAAPLLIKNMPYQHAWPDP